MTLLSWHSSIRLDRLAEPTGFIDFILAVVSLYSLVLVSPTFYKK